MNILLGKNAQGKTNLIEAIYLSSIGKSFRTNRDYEMIRFGSEYGKIKIVSIKSEDSSELEILIKKEGKEIKKEGNTIGGTITCVIKSLPVGIGEPVFGKLQAELAKAMMNINAAKGFEYGSGFCGAKMTGKDHNDLFNPDFSTKTNLSGGIQGGISNGMDVYFRVAFKPIATILRPQESVDKDGNSVTVEGKGRHDPCVLPRAVPIVENMAAFVLADLFLINRLRRI